MRAAPSLSTARLFATRRGYHVTEEAVKTEIAPSDYDEHLALMAMDVEAIRGAREGEGWSPARVSAWRRRS